MEIKNIHKSFGSNNILNGINLKINKGDVVVVLGPSGSGKTTLLRCLNFLEKADEGTIVLDGEEFECKKTSNKDIFKYREKTGFIFQNYNLFNNKTAIENIMLGLVVGKKINKKEAYDIAYESLKKVGLEDRCDFYPSQLSGGQQQRVGIARAIALKPEIMMFDEPTSALDPELIGEVLDVIKELADEGMTMIIVTHEMQFARNVANKIVFMENGVICAEGTPTEFFDNNKNERISAFIQKINNLS